FAMPVSRTMLRPAAGGAEEGMKGEYFSSTDLSGTPVMTRVDPEINFDWSGVSPLKATPDSGFSVRWTGAITAPAAGEYEFTLRTGRCRGCNRTQSYKVFVDGQQVAASEAPPAAGERPAMAINGTTGLPEERHVAGPAKFKVNFADKNEHELRIEFLRTSARDGSGITLEWSPKPEVLLPGALEAAKGADLVVAMVGLSPNLEGEEMPVNLPGFVGGDRTDIKLPAAQEEMLQQLAATGKPMVVVLLNGSALAVNWAEAHANAVLEAWYPGEAGGRAIADTLTGKNNPSGRLPVTFYTSLDELPPFTEYGVKNRTYRYFTGTALYGFGYGLSYTKFAYSKAKVSTASLKAGDPLTVEADVKNTGKMAGDEVAQVYLMAPRDGNGGLSPNLQLEGFQRVHLAPGQTKHVVFKLTPRELSEVDAEGVRSVQAGSYTVAVGGAQPKDPHAPTPAVTASFSIVGSQELPR
ncbi:MAG TPA: glycoside hydrolase family 3 C-terminal domain-containing protein, partial [Acidobacteriaceae bacterium]|nr:glycoside hydrolase family 3 C-terminal domain-containing protein [Acidobacteriaceae bacterium]